MAADPSPGASPPDIRHAWPDRSFHWLMAGLVVVLLATAFLPILGLRFDWVPAHWIAGVALTAAVLFHLYRGLVVHDVAAMLPTRGDLRGLVRRGRAEEGAKYDLDQKLYHWSVAATILLLIATGAAMLAKIDTPLWTADPSILSASDWGVVYGLHGAAAMVLIFFIILHVYYALLPDYRHLLAAMLSGGDTRGGGAGAPGAAPTRDDAA